MPNIYAVIVTYHPNITNLSRLLCDLRQQGVLSIVVDNGSGYGSTLEDIILKEQLIALVKNKGIAAAQNIGIKRAISLGAKYICFFDQDSIITDGFISTLYSDFCRIVANDSTIAAIGPRFVDSREGFFYALIQLNQYGLRKKVNAEYITSPMRVSLIISSGSLVPVDKLEHIGLMDENFFIDYVDTEWCLRALARGYSIYVSTALMKHAIGEYFIHLGRLKVPVHSAFRRYYRIRNAFYMLKMSHVPKMLVIRDIIFNVIHQLIIIYSVKNKKDYLKSLYKGVYDGISYLLHKAISKN